MDNLLIQNITLYAYETKQNWIRFKYFNVAIINRTCYLALKKIERYQNAV
jgi:hypothetical protein